MHYSESIVSIESVSSFLSMYMFELYVQQKKAQQQSYLIESI